LSLSANAVARLRSKREAFDQARPWWNHYNLIGGYFTGHLPLPSWCTAFATRGVSGPASEARTKLRALIPVADPDTAPDRPARDHVCAARDCDRERP
jgi:hypothetical protein